MMLKQQSKTALQNRPKWYVLHLQRQYKRNAQTKLVLRHHRSSWMKKASLLWVAEAALQHPLCMVVIVIVRVMMLRVRIPPQPPQLHSQQLTLMAGQQPQPNDVAGAKWNIPMYLNESRKGRALNTHTNSYWFLPRHKHPLNVIGIFQFILII